MIKPEVSHPTKVCPEPTKWSCYDSEATELEVIAFLKALVIMLKPKIILETGCYNGHSTKAMVEGVMTNGFGFVLSCDIGADKIAVTRKLLHTVTADYVGHFALRNQTGLEMINEEAQQVDFAFLDSGPDGIRIQELRALLPKLAPEGIVAIHDVGPQHGLRGHFDQAMRELGLQYIIFSTPRGLALVRKAQAL